MQSFLPYPNFKKSAQVLDMKRLGKQRLEALDILKINLGLLDSKRYRNHPAVKMWKRHEYWLYEYTKEIIFEWLNRGYKDTCLNKLYEIDLTTLNNFPPLWLGDEKIHSSHRAALLYKKPEWYGQFGWVEEPKIEYIWPVK